MATNADNGDALVDVLQRASDLIEDQSLTTENTNSVDDTLQQGEYNPIPHEYRQPVGVPNFSGGFGKDVGPISLFGTRLQSLTQPPDKVSSSDAKEQPSGTDVVPTPSLSSKVKQQLPKQGAGKESKGKAKPVKRRTWKKPKDKPKRPLSAYNLFFQHERERIIAATAPPPPDVEDEDNKKAANGKKPKRRRRHRKTHGKISFADLAKNISSKWKELDGVSRAPFEMRAVAEQERYKKEIEAWKKKKSEQEKERPLKEDESEAKKSVAAGAVKNAAIESQLGGETKRRSTIKTRNGNSAASAALAVRDQLGHDEDDGIIFQQLVNDPTFATQTPAPAHMKNDDLCDLEPISFSATSTDNIEPISIFHSATQVQPENIRSSDPHNNLIAPTTTLPLLSNDRLDRIYDIVNNEWGDVQLNQPTTSYQGIGLLQQPTASDQGTGLLQQPMASDQGIGLLHQPQFKISTLRLQQEEGSHTQPNFKQSDAKCMREMLSGLKQYSDLSMESCRSLLLKNESMRDMIETINDKKKQSSLLKEESMRNMLEVIKTGGQKSSRTFKEDESMAELLYSFGSLDSSLKDKLLGSVGTLDTTLSPSQPQATA